MPPSLGYPVRGDLWLSWHPGQCPGHRAAPPSSAALCAQSRSVPVPLLPGPAGPAALPSAGHCPMAISPEEIPAGPGSAGTEQRPKSPVTAGKCPFAFTALPGSVPVPKGKALPCPQIFSRCQKLQGRCWCWALAQEGRAWSRNVPSCAPQKRGLCLAKGVLPQPGALCGDKEGDAFGALGESTEDLTKHHQGFPLTPSPSSGAISLRTPTDFN